jgi:hypothetical protein
MRAADGSDAVGMAELPFTFNIPVDIGGVMESE